MKELRSCGSFGKCYLGYDELDGKTFAIKVIQESNYRPAEVDALIACGTDGHKSIVQFFNIYKNERDFWIIQEYVQGCELSNHVSQSGGLEESLCCNLFQQLTEAVEHIHGKQFIHGDLKPENILLSSNDSMQYIKLVDFGAAW